MPDYSSLRALLRRIEEHDTDYDERNRLILMAMARAACDKHPTGFRIDPAEPEWPVAFILLPTGQVSWHMPQFPQSWDGHTTQQKYERIRRYAGKR